MSARLLQSSGLADRPGLTNSDSRAPTPRLSGTRPRASPLLLHQPPPMKPSPYARTSTAALRVELRALSLRRSNPNGTPDPETLSRGRKARAAPRISNLSSASPIVSEGVCRVSIRLAAHALFLQTQRAPLPTDARATPRSILLGAPDGSA